MSELRENILLWKAFKFVIIPVIICSILGTFWPYMQAFVPVHESDTCVCLFFHQDSNHGGSRHFPIMGNIDDELSLDILTVSNTLTFYAVNWSFLLVNIIAIYRIRKMRDRLDIRLEMTWAVGIWSGFDALQYVFYFFT